MRETGGGRWKGGGVLWLHVDRRRRWVLEAQLHSWTRSRQIHWQSSRDSSSDAISEAEAEGEKVLGLLNSKMSEGAKVDGCRKGSVMYLVEWAPSPDGVEYPPSWEPVQNVCPELVAEYKKYDAM